MIDRTSFLHEMRLQFAFAPRWVHVSHAEFHANMERHYREHLWNLSRPAYHEAPGFTRDRWQLRGSKPEPWRTSICGIEKPYAWTGSYWRTFWRMVKHGAQAGYYETQPDGGGVHHSYDAKANNRVSLITGITS